MDIVCVGAVLNNACTLLESNFLKIFQETIKAGLPNTYLDQAYSVLHSATGAKLAGVADTDKQRQQFLACLNNAEVGLEYVGRLQLSTQTELTGLQATSTISSKQADKLSSFLTSITSWSTRDKFSRLQHIAAILNIEAPSEIEECSGINTDSYRGIIMQ